MAIRVSWGIWNPHFGEEEVIGVSNGTIRKSDGVSYRLSIVTVAIGPTYNHSAAICDRMSPALKSTRGGSLLAPRVDP